MDTDEQIIESQEPIKEIRIKKNYLVIALVCIVFFVLLLGIVRSAKAPKGHYAGSGTSGGNNSFTHSDDSIRPSLTPVITYPPQYRITLVRKTGNEARTIKKFDSNVLYSFKDVPQDEILRWRDDIFYTVTNGQLNNLPQQVNLIRENVNTGEQKIIYSSDSIKTAADNYFSPSGNLHSYMFQIPMSIIGDILFFSIKTPGGNGGWDGPGQTFMLNLADKNVQPQKFYDESGLVVHANGHYWLNDYVSPGAECTGTYTFRLFDISTHTVLPVLVQKDECGIQVGDTLDEIVTIDPSDRMLVERFVFHKDYTFSVTSVKAIYLNNPSLVDQIFTSDTIPDGTQDVSFDASLNKLFIAGTKAFYWSDLNGGNLQKISDFNTWGGEKLASASGMLQRTDEIHIAHTDANQAYVDFGTFSGAAPLCTSLSFSPVKLTKHVIYDSSNNTWDKNCTENVKPFDPLVDDLTPRYKTAEEMLQALHLPSTYEIQKEEIKPQ